MKFADSCASTSTSTEEVVLASFPVSFISTLKVQVSPSELEPAVHLVVAILLLSKLPVKVSLHSAVQVYDNALPVSLIQPFAVTVVVPSDSIVVGSASSVVSNWKKMSVRITKPPVRIKHSHGTLKCRIVVGFYCNPTSLPKFHFLKVQFTRFKF